MPQVITFQRCTVCVEIRQLNLQAVTQRGENSAATCNVPSSGTDLATPLNSQLYTKPELKGLQHCRDGNYPDLIIEDFREFLYNWQDSTHCVTLFKGTREILKHERPNMTYILDEQLHAMELCIYHGINVQLDGFDGEIISQICQCTGSQSWRGGDRWNVWV
jgi:hypothetical protein